MRRAVQLYNVGLRYKEKDAAALEEAEQEVRQLLGRLLEATGWL